jgi:RNA polymerase sigma-70 factor (ECF subfamily)
MENPAQDDAELMRRWQEGDGGAFVDLTRRWQQPMARFLSRLVGRPEQVADLCQEVFLRLYLNGPRYRENGTFSTWLYQIALNAARDAGRRAQRATLPLGNHEPTASTPDGPAQCEQHESTALVRQALAALAEPLRQVLVLRHYEDMSFEQMGKVLGTPASTLKSRFAVALNLLRGRLKELGWRPEESEE